MKCVVWNTVNLLSGFGNIILKTDIIFFEQSKSQSYRYDGYKNVSYAAVK